MRLNENQRQLVEDNINLVHKVINDKVHCMNLISAFAREDLFQIGCIGLCKAVATDKGGCFSTYAYRLIWNEICDALSKNIRSIKNEIVVDELPEDTSFNCCVESENRVVLYKVMDNLNNVPKSTRKGIQALMLKEQGYTCREIGDMYGVRANVVTAWISKARKRLRSEIMYY